MRTTRKVVPRAYGQAGVCSAGTQTCTNGALVWSNAQPSAEICGNGIDEDCNGADLVCPLTISLTVQIPNGGQNWKIRQSRTLKWRSTNVSGNVKIKLSRNNGGTWVTLFSGTPNDGQENWVVTGPPTTQVLICVSSVVSPSVFDVSDAVSTIH